MTDEYDDLALVEKIKDLVANYDKKIFELVRVKQELDLANIANATLTEESESYKTRLESAEAKIGNLHAIIAKNVTLIKRQATRITELEELYAGTKRSKKAKIIKAKYRALKEQLKARVYYSSSIGIGDSARFVTPRINDGNRDYNRMGGTQ